MKKINVAIFPCEAENAYELYRSLEYAPRFNVIGFGSIVSHSAFVFPKICQGLPFIQDIDFERKFIEALKQYDISYIFPTHDTVAVFLKKIEDKLPAKVLCSSYESALLCRNKDKIYEAFWGEEFCPKIYTDTIVFPAFAKPVDGQGGQGCFLLKSEKDLLVNSIDKSRYVIGEYLPGEEVTVDCFTNKSGNVLYAGARTRDKIIQGIACASSTHENSREFLLIAEKISKRLNLHGLWFFQLKKDINGTWKLLEVSTRIATTMNVTRHKGVNLPLLFLFDELGYDVEVLENSYSLRASRSLQTAYSYSFTYSTVYVDLDDTLIVDSKVNTNLIAFLYQCKNQKKFISLLTKHQGDVLSYLQDYSISSSLFNEIVALGQDDKKVDYITRPNAIFIDNLFSERKEALSKVVAVFDVDAVGSLLEYF